MRRKLPLATQPLASHSRRQPSAALKRTRKVGQHSEAVARMPAECHSTVAALKDGMKACHHAMRIRRAGHAARLAAATVTMRSTGLATLAWHHLLQQSEVVSATRWLILVYKQAGQQAQQHVHAGGHIFPMVTDIQSY